MSNRMSRILVLLFLLAAGSVEGKGPKPKCKKWPGIRIDDAVVLRSMRAGWYFPMMKEITIKPSEYFEEIPKDDRIFTHKECATTTSVSPFGSMKIKTTIKYNTTLMFTGTFENESGAILGGVSKVSMYADANVVMADPNLKEYMLTTYCIFGREPVWAVMSPKKKLSTETREKILDAVEKLGFNRDEVEDPDSTKLKPYKVKVHDCKSRGNGNALQGGRDIDAFA